MKPQDDTSHPPRTRRQFSAEEKVRLLRLHLIESKPISVICDEHQIHPTMFYQWQRTFFENGASAFERSSSRKPDPTQRKIEQLEDRLRKKDEVIAAVTEEPVRTKKDLGVD